ncbi:MAG: methyltransferase domain-containing protein [Pyrinomonadaceae bacterium]|nr:methyltransferase domain-containing protein [Pyrinomonadaceae bacterium]
MTELALENKDQAFQEFLGQIVELGGERLLKSLHTLPILRLIFDAQCFTRQRAQPTVLNIFASNDDSGFRENVYRPLFEGTRYTTVDFWQDKFICDGTVLPNSYTLPFLDDSFDAVITTKVLLEHISEPAETIREIARVLKPTGEAFVIAPFAMVIHQQPYDFFRYTEYGLQHLFRKAGLDVVYIRPTLSGFMTTVDAFLLFNFYGLFPKTVSRQLRRYSKRWLIPFAGFLDRRIPDERRFCRHYICRVRKP